MVVVVLPPPLLLHRPLRLRSACATSCFFSFTASNPEIVLYTTCRQPPRRAAVARGSSDPGPCPNFWSVY